MIRLQTDKHRFGKLALVTFLRYESAVVLLLLGRVSYTKSKMEENNTAKQILADLDRDVMPKVKNNLLTVTQFTEKLQVELKKQSHPLLRKASVMHGGSAYEGLAVKEMVDFDIIVLLDERYSVEKFTVGRDPSKYFTLHKFLYEKKMTDRNGYLSATKMQNKLFANLALCVKRIQLPGAEILCREGLASLDVLIKIGEDEISIDLAPQLACRSWGRCPDLKPLDDLPVSLRRYIDTLNKNASPVMFFSPAVPGRHPNQHRLFNVSFSQLEKKFLTSNTNIRDMVRLVKFVAERLDWKCKYGLKSFYVKRIAVKYSDHLQQMDLWDGYKALLGYISQELRSGTIDGYFVSDLVTYRKKPRKISKFQMKIAEVLKMNAREIQRLY